MYNADKLAHEMRATRQAFGYEYQKYKYTSGALSAAWKTSAPWTTGSMVRSASNMRESAVRDVSFRMPGHE